jgi:hypothetical protein
MRQGHRTPSVPAGSGSLAVLAGIGSIFASVYFRDLFWPLIAAAAIAALVLLRSLGWIPVAWVGFGSGRSQAGEKLPANGGVRTQVNAQALGVEASFDKEVEPDARALLLEQIRGAQCVVLVGISFEAYAGELDFLEAVNILLYEGTASIEFFFLDAECVPSAEIKTKIDLGINKVREKFPEAIRRGQCKIFAYQSDWPPSWRIKAIDPQDERRARLFVSGYERRSGAPLPSLHVLKRTEEAFSYFEAVLTVLENIRAHAAEVT